MAGMAAAGAAAGTAIFPGIGTAIGGIAGAYLDSTSSAGGAAAAQPTNRADVFGSSLFSADSSGWLVNFGGSQGQTNAAKTGPTLTATPTTAMPGAYVGAATPSGSNTNYLLIAGGVLLLVLLMKKHG